MFGGAFEAQLQFLVGAGVPLFVAMSILFVRSDKSPAQCFLEYLSPNKYLDYIEQLQLCLGQTGRSRTEIRRATQNKMA